MPAWSLKHISALQLRILKFTEICLNATAHTILWDWTANPIPLVCTDSTCNCKHPWMTFKNGFNIKNCLLFGRLRQNNMWTGIAVNILGWVWQSKGCGQGNLRDKFSQNATAIVAGAVRRLTKHGHFGFFSHAAQRWMRVEPDNWGMHEKLSHRDLCDLRETHRMRF